MKHGTLTTYVNKACRCDDCRGAMRVYSARQRALNRGILAADDPRHGTNSAYCNYGCRCRKCKDAHAKAQHDARLRAAVAAWR